MRRLLSCLVLLPLLAPSPPPGPQEARKLRPLAEILGDGREVRELEQSLEGDRLYLARRCLPLMVLLGSFLDQEPGQEESARTFTELGEAASRIADRLEAARTEESGQPSVEDLRVLAESVGYAYVERMMQNKKSRGHYYEGDAWLEGDVGFRAQRIPILAGEIGVS